LIVTPSQVLTGGTVAKDAFADRDDAAAYSDADGAKKMRCRWNP